MLSQYLQTKQLSVVIILVQFIIGPAFVCRFNT